MERSNTRGQSTASSNSLLQVMRRHPMFFYFLMAYTFAWLVDFPVVLSHLSVQLAAFLAPLLGPALAGFIMAAIMDGTTGVRRILSGFLQWRVNIPWYLFAILAIPIVSVLWCHHSARCSCKLSHTCFPFEVRVFLHRHLFHRWLDWRSISRGVRVARLRTPAYAAAARSSLGICSPRAALGKLAPPPVSLAGLFAWRIKPAECERVYRDCNCLHHCYDMGL